MATQSLTVRTLGFLLDASYRQTTFDGSRKNAAKFDHNWAISLANGTAIDQANFAWQAQYSISASGNQVIDLSALTDEFGNAIVPTKVKVFAVRLNTSTDATATLSVGNAASNAWTAINSSGTALLKVEVGGWMIFSSPSAAGYAVSAGNGTVKILNNGSAAATVDVVVVGVK